MHEELRKRAETIPGQEKFLSQTKSAGRGQVPSQPQKVVPLTQASSPRLSLRHEGVGHWDLSNQEAGEAGGRGDAAHRRGRRFFPQRWAGGLLTLQGLW